MINRNKIRCDKHRRYVASKPCMIGGCYSDVIQAHHLLRSGGKGMATKACDGETVPLCYNHHAMLHANGDEIDWFALHGWDYPDVLEYCRVLCMESPSKKIKGAIK